MMEQKSSISGLPVQDVFPAEWPAPLIQTSIVLILRSFQHEQYAPEVESRYNIALIEQTLGHR